tara:strand:+ start:412 stop:570 length:159 start_codon:yes stop_codon:yes gene_type:complete
MIEEYKLMADDEATDDAESTDDKAETTDDAESTDDKAESASDADESEGGDAD